MNVETWRRPLAAPPIFELVRVNCDDYDEMCEIVEWCGGRAIDKPEGCVIALPPDGRGNELLVKCGWCILKSHNDGSMAVFTPEDVERLLERVE